MSRIWTMDEIQELPEFGDGMGWFYGLIRYEGRLWFGEIFPGAGFANAWPRSLRTWGWALKDVWCGKPRAGL